MAALSFMESAKDKLSRVSGNPFSDHVEEATSDLLLVQDSEKIAVLVHFGNQGGEHVSELLNAVRRRIDHKNPKVQCFTVVVLDALIRNCNRDLHVELATNQKGLLRDLVLLAAKESIREAEFKARELAATLVVNCSYWFARYPDEKVREVMCGLVDHVRAAGGSLDGVSADPTFVLQTDFARPGGSNSINGGDDAPQRPRLAQRPQRAAPPQQQHVPHQQHQHHHQQRQVVVDAIPIKCPSDEELNGMMEAVLLLVECLNGTLPQDVPRNEMLNSIATQVRQQHQLVSSLVAVATNNNIEIANLDSLRSICDGQVEVLARHTDIVLQYAPPGVSRNQVDADEAAAIEASLADLRARNAQSAHVDPVEPTVITQPPPQPTTTASASSASAPGYRGTYRERLTRYYEFYNPGKLKEVDSVLAKFEGREEQMIRQLQAKYGAEPMPPEPTPAPAPVVVPAHPQETVEPTPAPVVPTIDELFASASAGAAPAPQPTVTPAPAPAQQPVDVFSATYEAPQQQPPTYSPREAPEQPAEPLQQSPPAVKPTRTAQDIDEPQATAPAPAPAPAPVVAAPAYAFPPMGQNMDPKRNDDAAAMKHQDASDAPAATEGTRSSSRPTQNADDDFDAFLNARLTH